MRWTGADIIAQLEDGWELDEIARATRLGIAEVRRLEREERYRMRQRQSKQEAKEMIEGNRGEEEEVEAKKQTTASPHEWQRIGDLAEHGRISPGVARSRVGSDAETWLHYERAPAGEHPGVARAHAKYVYRVRPGYPMRALTGEEIETLRAEHGEITPAVEPWEEGEGQEGKARHESADGPRSTDGADALEQISVLAELYELTPGQILEWGPDGLKRAIRDDRREPRREGSAERQEEIEQLRAALVEAREQLSRSEARVTRLEFRAASLDKRGEETLTEIDQLREALTEAQGQLAFQKKQEKGYQDAIGDLQCQVFERNERIKELESRLELTHEQTNRDERELLGEILDAADEGNPWPVLYRAKNEVRR